MTDEEFQALFERSEATIQRHLGELRGEMTTLRGEMTTLSGEMTNLRGEMAALRSDVDGKISDLKDHFDVTAEAMRHDVELVAELVGLSNARSDREFAAIRAEMAQGFRDTHELIQLAYFDADRRKH